MDGGWGEIAEGKLSELHFGEVPGLYYLSISQEALASLRVALGTFLLFFCTLPPKILAFIQVTDWPGEIRNIDT